MLLSDQKEITKQYFDGIVQDYLLRYVTDASAWECYTLMMGMLPMEDDLDVLDVGCGPGFIGWTLSLEGSRVVGIDLSQKMIDFANEHYASKNAKFQVADVECFTTNKRFDVVIAKGVFEYLSDDMKALKNIYNVLTRHGFLIAEFRNAGFKHGDPNYVDPYPMKRRAHSVSEVVSETKRVGFRVVDTVYYHYHKGLKLPEAASAFVMKLQKV